MLNKKGSLKETSAIKLLLTVFEQDKTGILYFKKGDTLKVLYLSRGKLIWATSNSDVDRLENILVSEEVVDPISLGSIKKDLDETESIGKALVEKGVITLEDLIGSTKTQLKGIILSVLKWEEGHFEFVEDTPPERLISLDLSVSDFIVDFILKDLESDIIDREIESHQIVLTKTSNEAKIKKYNLSDQQRDLLGNFNGIRKLEDIISEFKDAHGESLIKIVYFFIISDLVEKREADIPDLPLEEEELDEKIEDRLEQNIEDRIVEKADEKIQEKIEDKVEEKKEEKVEEKAEEKVEERIEEKPSERIEEKPLERIEEKPLERIEEKPLEKIVEKPVEKIEERDDLDLDKIAEESKKDDFYIFEKGTERSGELSKDQYVDDTSTRDFFNVGDSVVEDKKKTKQFYLLLVFVMLILIVGGVILFLLPADKKGKGIREEDHRAGVISVNEKKPEIQKDDSIKVKMKKEDTDNKKKEQKDQNQNAKDKPTPEKPDIKSTDKKKDVTTPDVKTPERGRKDKKPKIKKPGADKIIKKPEIKKPEKPKTVEIKTGPDYFKEGDLISAGRAWKDEITDREIKYSILLELDCMKESVMNAYRTIQAKRDFFILNRKMGERNCFLVLWGKFFSKEEASASMKSIPDYFWKQQSPPRVIELSQYL